MEHYLIYSTQTGEIWSRNSGPEGAAAQVPDQDGRAVMIVPYSVWNSTPLDMNAIKVLATQRINEAAEEVRKGFLTAGDGQLMTYQEKLAEARTFTADNATDTVFLTAEATARGMTVEALAAEIIATYNTWKIIGSRIEAARMGAKTAIEASTNLAELDAAIKVDWTAALTPAS